MISRPTILAIVLGALSPSAHSALIGRLPSTPGGTDYQAYYDTTLDITWVADANLARSQSFGSLSINPDGSMNWYTATNWIFNMNIANYLGANNWRLPTVPPAVWLFGSALGVLGSLRRKIA